MRHHSKNVGRIFGAHANKAVMDAKWKEEPAEGSWLATAGADRTVQVWDMNQSWTDKVPAPVHVLHTAHPLRRISWRPEHSTEIAIVPMPISLTNASMEAAATPAKKAEHLTPFVAEHDSHLEIWDVRRHYIAKYALPTLGGFAVDIAWDSGGGLAACFQHGDFAIHDIRDQTLPLEDITRNTMAWNSKGEVAFTLDLFKQGEIPFDDL
jgi:hypothetical protein